MSTPNGEPMIPDDYGTPRMTREMLLAWEVPHMAADRDIVKAVLREFMVRLLFEYGEKPIAPKLASLYTEALDEAVREYYSSKIVKESSSG